MAIGYRQKETLNNNYDQQTRYTKNHITKILNRLPIEDVDHVNLNCN